MTMQKKDRPVYHQQLVDYYSKAHPDWTNAQKGNAIWRDLCKVRAHATSAGYKWGRNLRGFRLAGLFNWAASEEGHEYWEARNVH